MITLKKYLIDNKELMKEWDYEKNEKLGIDPSTIYWGPNNYKYDTKNKPFICNKSLISKEI